MESRVRGGMRKEKIENIFMDNYGDIIFIIILELYFAYPIQFNVNHINPAILSKFFFALPPTPCMNWSLIIDN